MVKNLPSNAGNVGSVLGQGTKISHAKGQPSPRATTPESQRTHRSEDPAQPKRKHSINRKRKKVKSLSCVRLLVTPWTVAYQAPPSMGFSRQEYWSGLPFPSPGALPDPGIESWSPTLQADALPSEPPGKPNK